MLPRRRSQSTGQSESQRLWRLSGMGLELASHIVAGLLIGWLIDRWLDTSPIWLTVGMIAGLVVGMAEFIRSALKAVRQSSPRPARRSKSDTEEDSAGKMDEHIANPDE